MSEDGAARRATAVPAFDHVAHLLPQQWYNLSDPGAEEALYAIQSMRAFADLELGQDAIPDETTILNFRHLLERHDLTKALLALANLYLARGRLASA